MTAPRARARVAARRELADLGRHSPDLGVVEWLSPHRARLRVDLPYLGFSLSAPDEAELCRGFDLGIELQEGFPAEPPRVVFSGSRPIYHPAVSPFMGVFCLGASSWTPDLGLGRFVALHLEAIVGAVEVNTLDGIFSDPVCRDAAKHYRRLRDAGELPLARPRLASRPGRAGTARNRRTSPPERPSGARRAVAVRGSRGRLRVWLMPGPGAERLVAVCPLAGAEWTTHLSPAGRTAVAWLASRIALATPLRLDLTGGALILVADLPRSEAEDDDALRGVFEPALGHLDAPLLALADDGVATRLVGALDTNQVENES